MANRNRRAFPKNEKKLHMGKKVEKSVPKRSKSNVNLYVPLAKAEEDEQIVVGVVLQPETTDAQGEIYSESVVKKASHKFLTDYNKITELGLMHKSFRQDFELLESYIAPQDLVINGSPIKKGSWVIAVKVLDPEVWELVKKGAITGFSIGGLALVENLDAEETEDAA